MTTRGPAATRRQRRVIVSAATVPGGSAGTRDMDLCRLAFVLLVVCALALPFLLWGFRTYQLAFAATHAIAILGLNLIAGQAGLISLGHGAFYGLGAYTLAVLMRHGSVSAYAGILAAALVCLAAGYLFGRLVSRLARFYLALATFALALAPPQMLKSSYLAPWTGGVQGLYLDRPGAPLGLPLDQDQWWYFVSLGILALALGMPAIWSRAESAAPSGPCVVEIFSDRGVSRAKDKRPAFDRLLQGVTRKDFDVVAAWSVDRLGRSLQHLLGFLGELKAKGVDLYLHQQGLDTSTPAGRVQFQMLGVFAEFERAMIVERVNAGLRRAQAQGKTLGRPRVDEATERAIPRMAALAASLDRPASR